MSRDGAPPDPRRLAFDLLLQHAAGRRERLGAAVERAAFADERDRALCRELALGVLRYASLYEHLVRSHLHRRGRPPPALLTALSLTCHQLYGMDRIPAHAAVDTTVALLRTAGAGRLAGVANAVGRRLVATVLADGDGAWRPWSRVSATALPTDPATRLGLPASFLEAVGPRLERAGVEGRRLNHPAPLCTRSRPGHAVAEATPGVIRTAGDLAWWADPRAALAGPVARGAAVVQDPAQVSAVLLAEPRPGEVVLDLCAAPGGKARLLADRGCRVLAADRHARKVARLVRDLELPALVQDGTRPALAGSFDLVVVDAPCTNSGVFARRPEAKARFRPADLASLQALQRQLLVAASNLVGPCGRLLYCTCSLLPAENDELVGRLAGWRILRERWSWPDAWQGGGYAAVLGRG